MIRAPFGNTQFEYISTVNRKCCFILPHVAMLSHISPISFYDGSRYEKREHVCNEKNLMYTSLIEMDLLANVHTDRLRFCLNAQKIKPFDSFSVTNKGFLTSKSFLATSHPKAKCSSL